MRPRRKTFIASTPTPCPGRSLRAIEGRVSYQRTFLDPDTAMGVAKITYRAGFTNRWQYHHCSHGMYVLDGILKTHVGSFGPGSFVWFPEGMEMEHGATQDNDVTFLFITNKPFDIIYTFKDKEQK